MDRIEIKWNNVDITKQVDSKKTFIIDGKVPNFIFCGPFKTSGKEDSCLAKFNYPMLESTQYRYSIFK